MVSVTQGIAEAFVEARRSRRALLHYPGPLPADLIAAYQIQDHALALWNRPIGGWKVGRINPPEEGRLGTNRLAGPIFADTVLVGSEAPATMPVFDGGFAAAEAEFMLRLGPAAEGAPPASNAEARDCVDEIRIGIEIASSPYSGINRDGPCVTVSDQGNNAGLVLGKLVDRQLWDTLDQIDVTLDIDRARAGQGTTATLLDGPFGAVRFLLHNLAERGIKPAQGWWISSGAITGVHELGSGSTAVARFAGIGEVAAHIG